MTHRWLVGDEYHSGPGSNLEYRNRWISPWASGHRGISRLQGPNAANPLQQQLSLDRFKTLPERHSRHDRVRDLFSLTQLEIDHKILASTGEPIRCSVISNPLSRTTFAVDEWTLPLLLSFSTFLDGGVPSCTFSMHSP